MQLKAFFWEFTRSWCFVTAIGKYVQHMSNLMELIAISRLSSKCDLPYDSLDTGVREMRADIKVSPGKELGTI